MKNIISYKNFNESMENNSHNYFLPTYEECRAICDANDNFLFFETKHNIDGYNVSIFNYRLANASLFSKPIEGNATIKAHELRGLTFVWENDFGGKLYNRFLLLDKFFNLDQTDCSMYSVVKNLGIKNIYIKEDGSIASFIKLPNGKVVAKSKASFESDQAIQIQKIYNESTNLQKFVNWSLDNNIIPIFEYVSPSNRIVIQYDKTNLILLRMRDNNTGEYLDIENYVDKLEGITVATKFDSSLDELVNLKSTIDSYEGWIVQFVNGKMVKIKSTWYCDLHGLYTEDLNRENSLISLIINNQIDDVISQLSKDDDRRQVIMDLTDKVNKYILDTIHEVETLLGKFTGNVKDFAVRYRKDKLFAVAMNIINNRGKDIEELVKEKILNDTKHLMQARSWIKKLG